MLWKKYNKNSFKFTKDSRLSHNLDVRTLILVCFAILFLESCSSSPPKIVKKTPCKSCPKVEFKPSQLNLPEFLIISHRGSATQKPENTIEAYEEALREGANALEIDLSLTKDKKVVIWHDWDPNSLIAFARENSLGESYLKYRPLFPRSLLRKNFRVPIHKITLNTLRKYYGYAERRLGPVKKANVNIPTFEKFILWATNKPELKVVFLDIKTPEDEEALAPVLLSGIAETLDLLKPSFQIIFLTPYENILEVMKRAFPNWAYSFDTEYLPGIILNPLEYSTITRAINNGNSISSIGRPTCLTFFAWENYKETLLYDLELSSNYFQGSSKIPIISWTINREDEMEELIKMGIKGIITDYPARLKKVLSRVKK